MPWHELDDNTATALNGPFFVQINAKRNNGGNLLGLIEEKSNVITDFRSLQKDSSLVHSSVSHIVKHRKFAQTQGVFQAEIILRLFHDEPWITDTTPGLSLVIGLRIDASQGTGAFKLQTDFMIAFGIGG